MDPGKRKKLEAAGWKAADHPADFLGLSDAERKLVDLLADIALAIRGRRQERGVTQAQLADMIGSSQPRINRIENASNGVSLDLAFKALFALGGSLGDLGTDHVAEMPKKIGAGRRRAAAK